MTLSVCVRMKRSEFKATPAGRRLSHLKRLCYLPNSRLVFLFEENCLFERSYISEHPRAWALTSGPPLPASQTFRLPNWTHPLPSFTVFATHKGQPTNNFSSEETEAHLLSDVTILWVIPTAPIQNSRLSFNQVLTSGLFLPNTLAGMVSLQGMFPQFGGTLSEYCCAGPMCRYAEDLLLVFQVMVGEMAIPLRLTERVRNVSFLFIFR